MRLTILALAALLMLPFTVFAAMPETDPQSLALQLSDMPPGFVQVMERTGYASNEQWAATMADPGGFLAWLDQVGRVNGYNTAYQRGGMGAFIGNFAVLTSVGVYRSPEGAHAMHVERMYRNSQPVSSPVVGEESQATTMTSTDPNGYALRHFSINFRAGNILASVETIGTESTADFADALRYAQLTASRIQ